MKAPEIHQELIFCPSLHFNQMEDRPSFSWFRIQPSHPCFRQQAGEEWEGEKGPHSSFQGDFKNPSHSTSTYLLLASPSSHGLILLQKRLGNVVTMSRGKSRFYNQWGRREIILGGIAVLYIRCHRRVFNKLMLDLHGEWRLLPVPPENTLSKDIDLWDSMPSQQFL